jgi:hypothetical protein
MAMQVFFDYESLDANDRPIVEQRTVEIKERVRRTREDIIAIGGALIEVRARIGHGRFGIWLETEFAWTRRTAEDFMNIAEIFKSEIISLLDLTPTAMRSLAAPSVPESARHEALDRAANGQHIGTRESREIIDRHREYREYNPELDREAADQYLRERDLLRERNLPGQGQLFDEEETEEEEWEGRCPPPPARPISPWTSDDLLRQIRRALDHVDDVARAVGAKEKDGGYGGIKGSLARLTAAERLRLRAVLENLIDYLQVWADQIEEKFIEEEAE